MRNLCRLILVACLLFGVLLSVTFPPVELWQLWWENPDMGFVARRGAAVLYQAEHLGSLPPDPVHVAIRWRLLPALLPWPLAWSFVGAFGVLAYVVALTRRYMMVPWTHAAWVAGVFAAAGWFTVSVTWLGYYDSLLVLGLLIAAYGRPVSASAACAWGPWVDERFVLGALVCIVCRYYYGRDSQAQFRLVSAFGAVLLVAFVALRLVVLPNGHNVEPGSYLESYQPFYAGLPHLVLGLLSGWRLAWPLALLGWVRLRCHWALIFVVVFVVVVGLGTAQDSTRSMMLVAPAILVGLWKFSELVKEARWPLLGVALLLPAVLVVERDVSLANTWRGQRHLPDAESRILMRMYWRTVYGTWRGENRR